MKSVIISIIFLTCFTTNIDSYSVIIFGYFAYYCIESNKLCHQYIFRLSSDLPNSTMLTNIFNITTNISSFVTSTPQSSTQTLFTRPVYNYHSAEFEIFLPCIFGVFVILALSLIMFYTKKDDDDYMTMEDDGHPYMSKEGIQNRPEFTDL